MPTPRKKNISSEEKLSEIAGILDDGRRMRREALATLELAQTLLQDELTRVTREVEDLQMVQAQER